MKACFQLRHARPRATDLHTAQQRSPHVDWMLPLDTSLKKIPRSYWVLWHHCLAERYGQRVQVVWIRIRLVLMALSKASTCEYWYLNWLDLETMVVFFLCTDLSAVHDRQQVARGSYSIVALPCSSQSPGCMKAGLSGSREPARVGFIILRWFNGQNGRNLAKFVAVIRSWM